MTVARRLLRNIGKGSDHDRVYFITILTVTGKGTTENLLPKLGANYLLVQSDDADGSYVYSTGDGYTFGRIDNYLLQDCAVVGIPVNAIIDSVEQIYWVRSTNAAFPAKIEGCLDSPSWIGRKLGASHYPGVNYTEYSDTWILCPNMNTPWMPVPDPQGGFLDDLQGGIRIKDGIDGVNYYPGRCTYLYVRVTWHLP